MLQRIASAIGLILLCTWALLRVGRPPSPVPATAPDTEFSAERAMRHVEEIATRPHPMGTADHDRVRDYITTQLTVLGVRPQIQRATAIGTRYQAAGRVQNIVGWMPGSTANSKAAVLLVAHYDGVGAGPAASDDAAGSAALLETVRALRARKQPLAHDVIVLFTDGEEAGLLGAAAFVREHQWAKDVAVVLNFEARGTTGRSFMFETGPGNLDAARVLRSAGDPTAGSVFTTVYRALPNDTDLSELALLGIPALNFAFASGVERYHTAHDDVAHLNPGSLQHHGSQMLALAERFGNGVLPRPVTKDGVFFDLPIVGLVVYPQWLSAPLAIVALVLVGVLAWRVGAGVVTGAIVALLAVVLSSVVAWLVGRFLSGPAIWSGLYAWAIVLLVIALVGSVRGVALRWSGEQGFSVGALIVWVTLAVAASIASPGVGYLFTWPLLFAAIAMLSPKWKQPLEWLAVAMAMFVLAGFDYGVSVVMLGVTGMGAIALGTLSALVVLVIVPVLARVAGSTASRAFVGVYPLAAAIVLFVAAKATVHVNADHPIRSALLYAADADKGDAWLGTFNRLDQAWTRSAVGTPTRTASWVQTIGQGRANFSGHSVPAVLLEGPTATLARDTLLNGARRVVLRVTAPLGTTAVLMTAPGAKVLTASIDGRVVDTTRYRSHLRNWAMEYWAPPDTGGAIVALSIPVGSRLDFELLSRRPGLPPIPGVSIPPRPDFIVPSQEGDESFVRRRYTF